MAVTVVADPDGGSVSTKYLFVDNKLWQNQRPGDATKMVRLAIKRQQETDSGAETLVEQATSRIHRDILTGAFAPGAKLGIHELSKRYDLGPTPIREALSRLCPRGFVEAAANRGFRVHPISRQDLE